MSTVAPKNTQSQRLEKNSVEGLATFFFAPSISLPKVGPFLFFLLPIPLLSTISAFFFPPSVHSILSLTLPPSLDPYHPDFPSKSITMAEEVSYSYIIRFNFHARTHAPSLCPCAHFSPAKFTPHCDSAPRHGKTAALNVHFLASSVARKGHHQQALLPSLIISTARTSWGNC